MGFTPSLGLQCLAMSLYVALERSQLVKEPMSWGQSVRLSGAGRWRAHTRAVHTRYLWGQRLSLSLF